jgi:hypothetical protein
MAAAAALCGVALLLLLLAIEVRYVHRVGGDR